LAYSSINGNYITFFTNTLALNAASPQTQKSGGHHKPKISKNQLGDQNFHIGHEWYSNVSISQFKNEQTTTVVANFRDLGLNHPFEKPT
jgi:hypothetical protein